jgi:hypothetical protein
MGGESVGRGGCRGSADGRSEAGRSGRGGRRTGGFGEEAGEAHEAQRLPMGRTAGQGGFQFGPRQGDPVRKASRQGGP